MLIVLGSDDGELKVVDRRRVELVDPGTESWAKQPYHSAERLNARDAREVVRQGVEAANRVAVQVVRSALAQTRKAGNSVVGCAVLVSEPLPDWSVDEILAVHFRMHKAEGVLFRDALARAAAACGLKFVGIPEKDLEPFAERALGTPANSLRQMIAALGKSVGPPWGKDQKDAALAALIALRAAGH